MDSLTGWLGGAYLWVKTAHVIFTFFWIAGLFMLPRYLAYQAETVPGSPQDREWSERTARLRRVILTPAITAVWILGLMVATSYGLADAGWIHVKLALAVILSGYQGWMMSLSRKMAGGDRPIGSKKLRLWNELPALVTILAVGMAVLKPF